MPNDADPVNHPPHYTSHPSGVECIEITRHFNFNIGNAIKYLWRAGIKYRDGIEDLEKAKWYMEDELRRLRGEIGTRPRRVRKRAQEPIQKTDSEVLAADLWKERLIGIRGEGKVLPRGTVVVREMPHGVWLDHDVPKNGDSVNWLGQMWEYDEDLSWVWVCGEGLFSFPPDTVYVRI